MEELEKKIQEVAESRSRFDAFLKVLSGENFTHSSCVTLHMLDFSFTGLTKPSCVPLSRMNIILIHGLRKQRGRGRRVFERSQRLRG